MNPQRSAPRPADFHLLASITLTFIAGSSAPTPLYPIYQGMWGISPATVTAVFASYVGVLLAALLVFGRLSDHIGRKPVLLAATALQLVAMALFTTASSVTGLYLGRIIQGFGTGIAIAAVGAGMLDIDRVKGAAANAVAPAFGTALGAVVAGLTVHYLPHPTHLIYELLAAVYVLQGVGIALMPEPGEVRAGAWRSLRPQLGAPGGSRAALWSAVPILVAGWALPGFFASLGPSLMQRTFGLDASLAGGIALCLLTGSAGAAVLLSTDRQPHQLVRIGATGLVAGMAGVLVSVLMHSPVLFAAATLVAGAGFGMGFQGGVRSVLATAPETQRAGVLAVLFVVSYMALGLPALAAGQAVRSTGSLQGVALAFGSAVLALAAIAWRRNLSRATSSPAGVRA